MSDRTFQIELRQFEVTGANARHYFWVLKDDKGKVLGEIHGWPSNPKTGAPEGVKLGRQWLRARFIDHPTYYNQSLKLPFAIAASGSEEEMRRRWAAGKQMGEFLNKKGIDYHLLGDNSNAMAKTVGRAMGFEVEPILDPRVGNPYERPMPVSLSTDLAMRYADAPITTYAQQLKGVGGYGFVEPVKNDGADPKFTEFADPFRPTMPR